MNRKTIVIAAAITCGSAAVLGVFGLGAWFMVTHSDVKVGGDLASATSYTPTSEWIEEGLDPDVTTFGFGGKEAPEPSGPELSEYQIQQLTYQKQNDLMGCYATGLQENEDLQGRVNFQFGIAPDGHVAMVKITNSTMASKTTEDCMVAQARTWKFPQTNRASLMKFDTDFTFTYE